MAAYQRVIGPVADIPRLVSELGADVARVFAGLAITPADLVPGNLVPYADVLRLLARAAEETDRPHFGLLLGQAHDHRSLGPLGQLMANSATLGEALSSYVNWQIGYSRAGAGYLYGSGGSFIFGYGIYERQTPGSWQVYDLTIMVARNMVDHLTSGAVAPEAILISHRAPALRRPYDQLLKGNVSFDQSQNCLVLSEGATRTPLAGADPRARAAALEILRGIAGPSLASHAARARHVLRGSLCMGDVTKTRLAAQLGMHPKTMERRLAAEGANFEQLREDVRYVVARDLLDVTDLPVSDVALALSYATPSAFNHAFRRWSGTTPSEWRTRNNSGAGQRK